MSAAIYESILEKLQYLVNLEDFPFQQKAISAAPDMTAGQAYVTIPTGFNIITGLRIVTTDYERNLTFLDPEDFNEAFPTPENDLNDTPTFCTVKEGESRVYFNTEPDEAYALKWEGTEIPSDATNVSAVTQLTELAKLTLVHWAASHYYGSYSSEYDRAAQEESTGNKYYDALKKRYRRALEHNSRFISPKEMNAMKTLY